MKQIPRFQTLEKDKLVVPLRDTGAMEEGADLGLQIDLIIYDFEGSAKHSEGDIQQTVKTRL